MTIETKKQITVGMGILAKLCTQAMEIWIGIKLDVEANAVRGDERKISTDDSAAQVWVVPTNEELAIARETARLVCK